VRELKCCTNYVANAYDVDTTGWKKWSFSRTIVIILLSATLLTIFLAVFVAATCRARSVANSNIVHKDLTVKAQH